MALRNEQVDILGGPILQRPESTLFTTFSRYYFVFKSVTLLGLGLLVWIVCAQGLEHLRKHRELRYRKAMRRKHGIPDSDCRPFAVAYAAAKRAHLEREAQDRKKTNYVSDHNLPVVDQRTDPQKDARGLRRRVPETTVQLHDYQLPGKHAVANDNKRPEVHSLNFVDRYNPNPRRRVAVPEPYPVEKPLVRRASRKDLIINIDNHEESRKRTFDDESDVEYETIKKSRIDGDELVDGDEQADWYAQYADLPPRRPFKESLGRQPAGDHIFMSGRERSKRVNGFHDEDHEPVDEAMEGIDEDEVAELKAVARGKKRDRAEAGSTFGGDDDEDIPNGRASHHRKRRTIVQRTEVPARGQKRDRNAESPESGGEGGSETSRRRAQRSSKKKRGKKAVSDGVSESSAEDSRVSNDPLCSGRRVGDEWEADGVQYKVGNKGERLRLTLVKKARNKYHMPQDSQHPDRSAALEICVETWMTDEQYKQAEGRQELAWQEAPRESSSSKTPDVLDTRNGKNLLWDSVKGSPARPSFRQLIPAGASTRINPFEQWQLQSALGRRVATSSTKFFPVLPGVADSPTRPGFRGFSKWEKQDREAEALARIRAKIEEQKKAQSPPQKSISIEIPTSATTPELGTKSLSVPTITLTPAPVIGAGGGSDSSVPPSKSAPFFAIPSNTNDSTKSAPVAASATTGFSLFPASIAAATPSTLFPSVPTAPTAVSSTIPLSSFSFVKPPQVPSSTSAIASSSVIPAPFEKGAGAGMPSASTPGATTQLQPPSTENVSKPAPSFVKPDTSPFTPPPAVVAITKPQTPNFGTSSNSFGSIPTTTRTGVPTLPTVSISATASQGSKPTTPLFSFSGVSSSAATLPTSSALSVPKFSFGLPPTTSTLTSGSDLLSGTAPQTRPTFKFGQTPLGATEGDSTSKPLAADESKKLDVPVSVFSTGSNEPVKPSSLGTTSAFGSSTTNLFGKQVIGGSSTEKKTTFVFNAAAEGAKSASVLGSNTEGSKSAFSRGAEMSKPSLMFGSTIEGPKPTFAFIGGTENGPTSGPATESSKSSNTTDHPKSTFVPGTSSFSPALFGKDDVASNTSTSTSKPTASFTFGQSSTSSTSGDSNQSIFGKPTSATPSAFGFGIGGSSSSSAFTFGKPAAQNQKQEQ